MNIQLMIESERVGKRLGCLIFSPISTGSLATKNEPTEKKSLHSFFSIAKKHEHCSVVVRIIMHRYGLRDCWLFILFSVSFIVFV